MVTEGPVEAFSDHVSSERARRDGLLPSLGTMGDPYTNAMAEAFWARMQTELLDRQRCRAWIDLANDPSTPRSLQLPPTTPRPELDEPLAAA